MKKITVLSFVALSIATLFSCQKAVENEMPKENTNLRTLTCAFPAMTNADGTKVSLASNGKTQWVAGDKLVIFGTPNYTDPASYIVHEIKASEITNPEVAQITVDLSGLTQDDYPSNTGHKFNVAFPYSDSNPSFTNNSGYAGGRVRFNNTNQLLMGGYITDDETSIVLNNLCAAIVFQVSGTFDSYVFKGRNETEIVGYDDFLAETNGKGSVVYRKKYGTGGTSGPKTSITGPVTSDGTTLNYIFLPVNTPDDPNGATSVSLPNGFTIMFKNGGDIVKTITSSAAVTLLPGHMINLGVLPAGSMHDYVATAHNSSVSPVPDDNSANDLSKTASANCYIVEGTKVEDVYTNQGQIYKFKAYKGKGTTPVGTIQSVGILWETYNNTTAVTEHTVIAAADYDKQEGNSYYEIVFQMPANASFHPGNAVIAAYDGPYVAGVPSGNIVWSWHIWIPATTIGSTTDATNFGATIMNRNLGALVDATTDTPSSPESYGLLYQWGRKDPFPGLGVASGSTAASVAGTEMTYHSGHLSVDDAIANPTKFAYVSGGDWNTVTDGSLWAEASKTMYDPCPEGYKVPARASSTFWGGSTLIGVAGFTRYDEKYSFKLGDVVFPLAGYIDDQGDSHKKAGLRTVQWTGRYNSGTNEAYGFYGYLDSDGPYFKRTSLARSRGGSVRCVAE